MNGNELYNFAVRCFRYSQIGEGVGSLSLHLRFLSRLVDEEAPQISERIYSALSTTLNLLRSVDATEQTECLRFLSEVAHEDVVHNIELDLFPQREMFDVAGERLVFVGRHPSGALGFSDDMSYIESVLQEFKARLSRKSGRQLRLGLPIYVPLVDAWLPKQYESDGTLSLYDKASKALIILPKKVSSKPELTASLGHEYGHFFYGNVLSTEYKQEWQRLYTSRLCELNILEILDSRPYFSSDAEFEFFYRERRQTIWKQVHSLFFHPKLHEYRIYDMCSLCEVSRDKKNGFFDKITKEKILVESEPITQYSIYSVEEAFCEALGLFVAEDYREVSEITETLGPRCLDSTYKEFLRSMLVSDLR